MKIAVLKGDGIGPEIVEAAQLVLNKVDEKYNLGIEYAEALFGVTMEEKGVSKIVSVLLSDAIKHAQEA